jgi:hypothetical protein
MLDKLHFGEMADFFQLATGLCGQEWHYNFPPRNCCPAFDKDKCLEPMFGEVVQAQQKPGYAELLIATTSSRTLQKTQCWLLGF